VRHRRFVHVFGELPSITKSLDWCLYLLALF
jgi:hypothetical protein